MDGGVQIIDQLRSDGRLGENQLDGGKRVLGVALKHETEGLVAILRLQVVFLGRCEVTDREIRKSGCGVIETFANLAVRPADGFARKPLPGVAEHELIAFFDGGAKRPYV